MKQTKTKQKTITNTFFRDDRVDTRTPAREGFNKDINQVRFQSKEGDWGS